MKKTLLSALALAIGIIAFAQQPVLLPIDSAVRVGHLDNGLTYYIRHNEWPKQRCEFHIAQAVGAILEEDDQNGLAHFLEHMAFNGTEHFQGKGIINYFESIGVNFGGNINAYTSLDETVYRLSEVPTYREGIIDSALLVMHDWACGLLLEGDEIDAERGVIREEWRTRSEANRRMWSALNPLMFPGSQYAKRDVIGDTAVINNFTYDALRAYYKKWYGPDNQAIVVVGDINVDSIEAKIKALWANVPARVNRGERPIYTIDDNNEPIIAQVKDKEAQYSRIVVDYKKPAQPKELRCTTMDYITDLAHDLICAMMDNRLDELAQNPNASFIGAGCGYGEIVKNKDTFEGVVVAKQGQEKQAYEDLLFQLEKMRRYGFTNAELERVKTEKITGYEKAYNERNSTRNINYTRSYIRHFLDDAYIPGIEWEYKMLPQILPMLTLDIINQEAKALVTDENIIVSMTAPEAAELPSREECLAALSNMKNLEITAPVEETMRTNLVEKAPKKGKIKSMQIDNAMGTSVWTLSNGIRVIIKPTEFKQDEILMKAYSFGGLTAIDDPEDLYSARMATSVVEMCGIGDFSRIDLQKALTGKYVAVSPSIGANTETLGGSSNIKDFETMLQLAYLYMTAPRRDEEAFKTLMSLLETQLKNKEADPKSAWSDSIRVMCADHSPRGIIYSLDNISKINMDKALQIYKERFANPADFTFFFIGNIDPNDELVQQQICQWIGGLKTKKCREEVIDRNVRVTPGMQKNYFQRSMLTKTGSNFIQYTAYNLPYTMSNETQVDMIGRILDIRYLESIREREGGSYGVGTSASMYIFPKPSAELTMYFDTDPDKQAKLMSIIHEEVQTIAKNGPLAEDLSKVQASMVKDFDEDIEKNSYWYGTILPSYYIFGDNYLTDYVPTVQAVTAESIRQTLQLILDEGNVMEVVMMPAEE